jgi:pimeloyl-ACP methyl ester carboxylesterase
MQVIVQDLATNYTRLGKGQPVLILHGWGDTSQSWSAFAKALSAHYEVIIPDLPGFGGTEAPHEAWNLTCYAQFVHDFLQKIGIKPYAVIGHSNGGAIAIRGIGQGIFQADKLVLLASAGVRTPRAISGLQVMAKVGKAVSSPLPKKLRTSLRRKLYEKAGSDLLVAEHLEATFKKIVRDDVRADAAYISTPTLLVYGDADTATPLKLGQELQNVIEGSRLEVVTGAGHFIHLDAAVDVQRLTEDFLG